MTVVAQVSVLGNRCNSCCVSLLGLSRCSNIECVLAPLPKEESANFPKDHKLLCQPLHTHTQLALFPSAKDYPSFFKSCKTFKVVEDSNLRKSEEMRMCSSIREKYVGAGAGSQQPGPHRSSIINPHPTIAPFGKFGCCSFSCICRISLVGKLFLNSFFIFWGDFVLVWFKQQNFATSQFWKIKMSA